jgi:predicted metal-dependent phosphoesterase TrpH
LRRNFKRSDRNKADSFTWVRDFGNLKLKIDLHVHTIYSSDSSITPKQLVFYAKKRGLDGVAVTDHDKLDSSLKICRETDFLVLPGMEISSADGHIVALNVHENIPKGLRSEETVTRIHEAGGIAIACHPITLFKGSLGKHVTSDFDAIEVINSSAFPFRYSRKRSEEIASRLGIARVAGTDAHFAPEIGYAFTLIDAEPDVGEMANAIKNGKCEPCGGAIPLPIRLRRELYKLLKLAGSEYKEANEFGEVDRP